MATGSHYRGMVAKRTPSILARYGDRLRKLRQAKGISQEAFADRCGLDRTYISGIERGRRNLSLVNIEVVAKALGISIAKFFEGVEG